MVSLVARVLSEMWERRDIAQSGKDERRGEEREREV